MPDVLMPDVLRSRGGIEPPISQRIGASVAALLGIIGLVLFVYADRASNRPLRLAAVLVVTLALVVGMVLTVRRNERMKAAPGKKS
jgi:hypothetical protein